MKWTDEEEDFLRENYLDLGAEECGRRLGNRSATAIRKKARRLGIARDLSWSEEERQYLRENWPEKTVREISQHLNRSISAIQHKRERLGLRRKDGYTGELEQWDRDEEFYILANYPEARIDDLAGHLDRSYGSVSSKIFNMGLTRFWQAWENRILFDFYGKDCMTAKELSESFLRHRHLPSIRHRAFKLGLSFREGRIEEKVCPECGKTFQVFSSHAYKRTHCSKSCANKADRSDIEIMIKEELEKSGINFEEQETCGPYSIDFVIGDIALETDGDYWHREGVNYERDNYLREYGYIPIHYWGSEIRDNVEDCVTDCVNILGGI